jgi:aspartate carbamoyltransferase
MKNFVSTNQIETYADMEDIFLLAERYRSWFEKSEPNTAYQPLVPPSDLPLVGKVVATVFHERSTRTRLSFEAAVLKLGGSVITETELTSSSGKNESLEDTIRTTAQYADLIVLRHPEGGAARRVVSHCPVPVVNGGDGNNEHPTQALLDVYTVWRKRRDYSNWPQFRVMFVGDLADSRPVHSWINLIANKVTPAKVLLAPTDGMGLTREWAGKITDATVVQTDTVPQFLGQIDVLYMTRVQTERKQQGAGDVMKNWGEKWSQPKQFVLRPEHMEHMLSDCLVLHPMPRNSEIHRDCDVYFRSMYHTEQVKNGLYLRMALMAKLLGN